MKRRSEDRKITRREWKEHRLIHIEVNQFRGVGLRLAQRRPGSDPEEVDCPCDRQVGRFRKLDAYDCGKPGCGICHGDKFPKRSWTRQEIRAALRFQEQLQEFFQGDLNGGD
jgi:hypothetical protein